MDRIVHVSSVDFSQFKQDDIPMYEKFKQSNAASKNMVFDDDKL